MKKLLPGIVISFLFLVFVMLFWVWLSGGVWQKLETQVKNVDLKDKFVELSQVPSSAEVSESVSVVDGDTIDVDGKRVRYIGVDTPELEGKGGRSECFADEARDFNQLLVSGQSLRMEKDVSEVDRYGRLLRYVYLPDGRMVNEELIKEGFAKAATFPPDVAYAERFVALERGAREMKKGLWGKC